MLANLNNINSFFLKQNEPILRDANVFESTARSTRNCARVQLYNIYALRVFFLTAFLIGHVVVGVYENYVKCIVTYKQP